MNLKKIGIVFFIAFTARLVISCCHCPDPKTSHYTYTSFQTFNLDNSGAGPVVSETNIIPKKAYGIRVEFSLKQVTVNSANFNSLFSEARADCICAPDSTLTARDTISSIVITTVNDFDSQHLANSAVTDLFKALISQSYIPITDFINNPEMVFHVKPVDETIDLYLITPPGIAGEQSFKFYIALSDQRVLSGTTQVVNLE
jgi:hypothetical protein